MRFTTMSAAIAYAMQYSPACACEVQRDETHTVENAEAFADDESNPRPSRDFFRKYANGETKGVQAYTVIAVDAQGIRDWVGDIYVDRADADEPTFYFGYGA